MRSIIASTASYIFMSSLFSIIMCIFAIALILIRNMFGLSSDSGNDLMLVFIKILIVCAMICPAALYVSNKLGRGYTDVDIDY